MMPRTSLQCLRSKKRLQQFANFHLEHVRALLQSKTLQFTPKILTVNAQQVQVLYSLVEVILLAKSSSIGVTSPPYTWLRSHHHYVGIVMNHHANARRFTSSF